MEHCALLEIPHPFTWRVWIGELSWYSSSYEAGIGRTMWYQSISIPFIMSIEFDEPNFRKKIPFFFILCQFFCQKINVKIFVEILSPVSITSYWVEKTGIDFNLISSRHPDFKTLKISNCRDRVHDWCNFLLVLYILTDIIVFQRWVHSDLLFHLFGPTFSTGRVFVTTSTSCPLT